VEPLPRSPAAAIAGHDIVRAAWDGIDAAQVWDCHAHLAGIGDGGSGIRINPRMLSPLHPTEYLQRLFYLNAGCAHQAPGRVDQSYLERLHNLADGMQPGFKLLLFAFEQTHDARPAAPGSHRLPRPQPPRPRCGPRPSGLLRVGLLDPPAARRLRRGPRSRRPDGARAVKWLPPAMGIDPASPACDRFYRALARLDLPLITHAGEEKAVHGAGRPAGATRCACAGRSITACGWWSPTAPASARIGRGRPARRRVPASACSPA
jgi:mannonate dehydratase